MEKYTLFLDEIDSGGHFHHFCLAGVAMKLDDYQKEVIPAVEHVKRKYFEGDTSVVLHEMDIHRHKTGTPFKVFQDDRKMQEFWDDIKSLFSSHNFHLFAVAIHEDQLKATYPTNRDKYMIALQVITENYLHFLEKVDGSGNIFIESSNPHPHQKDDQLQFHFYNLKANGTLFFDRRTFQTRISTFNVLLKSDNNIGLQLADLIPNSLNRHLSGKDQRTHGLITIIQKMAYDGFIGRKDLFGIKIIP
ncbi:DUF3800 domain-containing protein [Brevibacillus sp. GCM10020057]|uniref:DUF3800 domain-containing protein n=1 Tax=Brevibacillus sp. GCM10020057 TaxID=3317327 RepID=UPI00363799C5